MLNNEKIRLCLMFLLGRRSSGGWIPAVNPTDVGCPEWHRAFCINWQSDKFLSEVENSLGIKHDPGKTIVETLGVRLSEVAKGKSIERKMTALQDAVKRLSFVASGNPDEFDAEYDSELRELL